MQTVATVETSASVTGEVPISMKRMLFLTDNSAFLARLGTTMIMQHDPFPPETSIPSEYDEIMRPAVEENNTLSRISTLLQNGLGGLLPFFQQRPPVLEDSDSDDSD